MESERRIYKDRRGRVQKASPKIESDGEKREDVLNICGELVVYLSLHFSLHVSPQTSDTLKCVNPSFHISSGSGSPLCLSAACDKSMVLLRFQMW